MAAILLVLATGAAFAPARGQDGGFVPSFWDPARRLTGPDMSAIHLIRFLTSDDYPPFDFVLPDGALTGFSVDLARAVCEELKVACTVQARRWDTLATALADNKGDALIAGLAITDRTREQFAFTRPYMLLPGRFVTRAGQAPAPDATPERMGAAKAGVNALTYGLARTFGPKVRVNCIVPGPFLTDISKAWDMESFEKSAKAGFALQRGGEPDEIVGAALYFATAASSYTTGTTLNVDGGPR